MIASEQPKEPAVNRHLSPSLALVAALAMCLPSLFKAVGGSVTIDSLCLRLLLALVASYAGLRVINAVIAGYGAPRPAPAPSELSRLVPTTHRPGREADAA